MSVFQSFSIAILFGLLTAGISWLFISKVKEDRAADRDFHFASVEKVFAPMMLFTACAMAFAHGSNDVANGIGPLAAATTVVIASRTGLPVSATHILVGSVLGVGLARGIGALDLRVVIDIFISWLVTLPAGAIMAMLFFFVLKGIFS